jgi:propionyl-CoA synthetase
LRESRWDTGCRHLLAYRLGAQGEGAVHGANRIPRHPREDSEGLFIHAFPMPDFRALFLAGERADPETLKWAENMLGVPVIDHWWQTETGWPVASNPLGLETLPVKHGSPSVPMPGYDIEVLDDAGHAVPTGTLGNVVVKLPLPPGCLPTLLER